MSKWDMGKRIKNRSILTSIFLGIAILIVAAGIIGYSIYQSHKHPDPIPGNIRKQLSFNLYYPTTLPAGYSVNTSSFETKGKVLIFAINAPDNKSIAVSEEVVPSIDAAELGPPDSPAGSPIDTTQHITVPAGRAVIGLWGENFVSSLVAGQTWIILNLNGFTYAQASAITTGFRELQ